MISLKREKTSNNMRIDKYLCDCLSLSRNDIKNEIKKGFVIVNDSAIKDPSIHVNEKTDVIKYNGEIVSYQKYHYYVLNKPSGVITARKDKNDKTVFDILDFAFPKDLAPVGRLDKDTEGLLLLTNDGELSHRLLSPKSHIDKGYLCRLEKDVTKEDIMSLETGINIGDDTPTLPAKAVLINPKEVELYICEGRYHQVKRMFQALCNKVIYLKRISFGPLKLDALDLNLGQCIELDEKQIKELRDYKHDK